MDILENGVLSISLTPCAAAIHSIFIKPLNREITYVLEDEAAHLHDPSYSGNTVGMYAGRIRNAEMVVDGCRCRLDRNEGENSIHGGARSLRRTWDVLYHDGQSVSYATQMSDMEDGLPGNRTVKACYTLSDQGFSILYEVKSDRPTFCNLTNHVYFNLDGDGTIRNHVLMMNAPRMWMNDDWNVPLMRVDTDGTVFDFGKGRSLHASVLSLKGTAGRGLNNIFEYDGSLRLEGKELMIEICSDAPAVLVYSGGFLGKEDSFVALESQSRPVDGIRVGAGFGFTRLFSYEFQLL